MRAYRCTDTIYSDLIRSLEKSSRVIAPVRDPDGAVRLQQVHDADRIVPGARAMIPPKKYLLPGGERLWDGNPEHPRKKNAEKSLVMVGLPPCDIHSVALLDQTMGDDPSYRARRRKLTLIAAPCTPSDDCRCQLDTFPSCDLFVYNTTLWALSSQGQQLAQQLKCPLEKEDLPLPSNTLPERRPLPINLSKCFDICSDDPRWAEIASRCLSCGTCSAVCPTCFCYDLRDSSFLSGETRRERRWDNCLFSDFARVAGGHDFRPGTAARLHFRMRHKLLGFGSLQGPNCLGCGRCRHYCPVDIGPEWLLDCMQGREKSA